MQKYDFTAMASGVAFVVHSPGRYLKYLTGTAGGNDASITVTPGGKPGARITLYPGQAITLPNDKGDPDSWTIANALGQATITGTVIVGDGRMDDNSLQGTVQVVDGGKARTLSGAAFMGSAYQGVTAGQAASVALFNLATSGKRIVVEAIGVTSSMNAGVAFAFQNAALPNVLNFAPSKCAGLAASVASQFQRQPSASVLTAIGQVAVTAAGYAEKKFNEPLVIMPGWSLTLWHGVTGADLTGVFEFFEEPNV